MFTDINIVINMEYTIKKYDNPDNERRNKMIDFISEHNDKFAEYTLIESAKRWNLIPNVDDKSDEEIIEGYYERLFGTVIMAEYENEVIGIVSFKKKFGEKGGWLDERVKDEYLPLHWFSFILIDEGYRRKGVWSNMYEYVKSEVIPSCEQRYGRLGFATSSRKDSMKNFASKYDFNCVKTVPDDRGEEIDSCIYMKELDI